MGQTNLDKNFLGNGKATDEFREKYRGKQDSLDDLRQIQGFPIGEDKDIQGISDPPYFTAYPNPHIGEFILKYGRQYAEETDAYHREPFVGDISEGKGDQFYNLHTYHTKVPYKAISKFIEHYTEKGDIVFDGFCGTGMTGISAQTLGRHCILVELSPVAAFISYNLNTDFDADKFRKEAHRLLEEVARECEWMFETWHPSCESQERKLAHVNFVVWNDLFVCPYCGSEAPLYVSSDEESTRKDKCENCDALLPDQPERAKQKYHDDVLNEEIEKVKEIPVLINYKHGRQTYWKKPDRSDIELIHKIDHLKIPYWFPIAKLPKGYNTEQPRRSHGIEYVHQMYTKRSLWVFASLWDRIGKAVVSERVRRQLFFWVEALSIGQTYLNRYFEKSYSQVNRYLKGTLYIASKRSEVSPRYSFTGKIDKIADCRPPHTDSRCLISTQSTSSVLLQDSSVDYIFTDPPFGKNLMYSELNFIWESWLKIFTNTREEAIINEVQGKGLDDYRRMMFGCFSEMFRILKPNRWMTVVFHNSKAEVWNAIQESIGKAGFIVAQVATLDKQQMTMKQWAYPTSVKNDLVINAYRPMESFAKAFLEKAGSGLEIEFVKQHLERLPVDQNIERTEQMLYSKMIAYYIQHGYEVNMNSRQFYALLRESFDERDGYWFLEDQVDLYDEKKKNKDLAFVQATLFISDERSAIQWLNWFLREPKEYAEIYPEFIKALTTTPDEIPELKELIDENFSSSDDKYRRPQPLEKEDIEVHRNRRLQKQFEGYLEKAMNGETLERVRKEAVLAGFLACYQEKRFQEILTVGKGLPKDVVDSSTEIYDLIDVAKTKAEAAK